MNRQHLMDQLKEKFMELRTHMKGDSLIDSIVSAGKWLGLKTTEIFSVVSKDVDTTVTVTHFDTRQKGLMERAADRAHQVLQGLNIQKYLLGKKVSPVAISNAQSALSSAVDGSGSSKDAPIPTVDAYTRGMAFGISTEINASPNTGIDRFNQKKKGELKKVDIAHDKEFVEGLKKLKNEKGIEPQPSVKACTTSPDHVKSKVKLPIKTENLSISSVHPSVLKQRD